MNKNKTKQNKTKQKQKTKKQKKKEMNRSLVLESFYFLVFAFRKRWVSHYIYLQHISKLTTKCIVSPQLTWTSDLQAVNFYSVGWLVYVFSGADILFAG